MMIIKKSILEWINLFKRLNDIKGKYGSSIFSETILLLNYLEHGKMISVENKVQVLDLLVEYKIDNFALMKAFLEKLIFNLEKVISDIVTVQEKFGLDTIAFILDEPKTKRNIPIFYSKCAYERVYFPKDVIPIPIMNFMTGDMQYGVNPYTEFIVDKSDGKKLERTLYTDDFRLSVMTFPLKSEMDYYNEDKEKRKWMDQLIFNLSYLNNANTEFLVQDPNKLYDLRSKNAYQYYTFLTDGSAIDGNGNRLESRSGYFKDVIINNADVLLICQINQGEIQSIKFLVHPLYFKKYLNELQKEQENGMLAAISSMLKHNEDEKKLAR